jgi:transposase-like protein/IS1 family transposase
MECQHCQSKTKKFGRTTDGRQRYRCLTLTCRKITVEARERVLPGIKVPDERALMVLQLLCEGVSVRAVERLTGTEKRTILRLLVLAGDACERMLAEQVRGVEVNDVECDEIWGYVHCKEATKKRKGIQNPEAGDTYTFTAIDRESKLLLAFQTGRRSTYDAHDFMVKVAAATAGDFQVSTDAWSGYPETIEFNLGARVSYGMVVKEFAPPPADEVRRYGPPRLSPTSTVFVLTP